MICRVEIFRGILAILVAAKVDFHGRAFVQFAIYFYVATGLADEPIDLAQSKASTLADLLGCEKWVERSLARRAIHSDARVCDRNHHVLPRFHRLRERAYIGLIEITIRGLDRQLAAIGHGIAGIEGEIEDCVLELIGIGEGAPQAPRQHGFEGYLFA